MRSARRSRDRRSGGRSLTGGRGGARENEPAVPKGSFAAGRRVRLPRAAEPPITVYVNGIAQQRGRDYELRGNEIVFARPIVKETVGRGRWLAMFLGLFGTYRKHEVVDVEYRRGGKVQLAHDLEVRPG
jgi:hypothetical protein